MAKSYLLKITLEDTKPPVWRRFVVPADIKLDKLHDVIQVIMGWTDSHLHAFEIGPEQYGPHMDDDWAEPIGLDESRYKLSSLVTRKGTKFHYTYDFGDNWEHVILVEDADYQNPDWPYPIYCLKGKRACPPEDCGSTYGYYEICQQVKDGSNTDEDNWYGDFDPEAFDLDEINAVLNPQKSKKKPAKKEMAIKSKSREVTPKVSSNRMLNFAITNMANPLDPESSFCDTEEAIEEQINKIKSVILKVVKKMGDNPSLPDINAAVTAAMSKANLDVEVEVTFSDDTEEVRPAPKPKKKSAKKGS